MMTDTIEMASFFELPEIDTQMLEQYADAAHASYHARERFDTLVREKLSTGRADPLRVALGLVILGRFRDALEQFAKAPASPMRHYFAADAALALNRFEEAIQELREAGKAGWDRLQVDMRIAEVHVRTGDFAAAEKIIESRSAEGANRAEWHSARGFVLEAQHNREAALQAYEKSLARAPQRVETLFRAARLHDLSGEDDKALELYDRLTGKPRAHVNALLNAAVLYEDRGQFDAAMLCLKRVLKSCPNHRRARLFMKSVESCRQMMIEEVGEQPVDARTRLLATPLSEFELSVRARNCLKKMNIRMMGELMRLTEAELLAYKNFGETSLNEIKTLLSRKGLRLGMRPDEVDTEVVEQAATQKTPLPPGQEAILSKPVSDLELSVRSRRCLQRLNVQTLGDLVRYTEGDLLATRNFGVTSLNEIKARLTEVGLQLSVKHGE